MSAFHFRCTECAAHYAEEPRLLACRACGAQQPAGGSTRGVLEVLLDALPSRWPSARASSVEFLQEFLPLHAPSLAPPIVVGDTPISPVPRLRQALGMSQLWVKDDTRNPSGSTKDRASWLVVAKAREYGFDTVATASTGNAATALAAVAAAAGTRAVVFVPATAPQGKLAQMLNYGATVLPIAGSYDEAFELCLVACREFRWYNRNTALNPFTIEGKKTVALEIAAARAPDGVDVVVVPTGDGVILAGVSKGFRDLRSAGLIEQVPRLLAVQPEGSAAIVHAVVAGTDDVEPVLDAASVADSLTVQTPRNARQCLSSIRASGGGAVAVSDEAILRAIPRLARTTGIFAEPAGAAALAGLDAALVRGLVDRDERVCLLVTGTGLKDVPAAMQAVSAPHAIEPTLDAVAARLRSAEGGE